MHALPLSCLLCLALTALAAAESPLPGMVAVPGGSYKPLYAREAKPRRVAPFQLDIHAVTNAQFLDFVTRHPEWRRSRVSPTQADAAYLRHWAGDLDLGQALPEAPVTHVSWHAARAYAAACGRRLPDQDEWEFAARADARRADASADPEFLRVLLEWYSTPASKQPKPVQQAPADVHGVRGLHGQVWEWVEDFNATLLVGDGRGDGAAQRDLFCGGASLLAADPGNYAAYMRYAFRASLRGHYCVGSLGFRTAAPRRAPPEAPAGAVAHLYDLAGDWLDQKARPTELADLRGRVRVLSLGFTRCQSACPRTLADLQRIEAALGADADRIGFVFLSIDPEHDRPPRLLQAMAERGMSPQRWTFLTAPDPVVREAAVLLDFQYQWSEGFLAHSNLIAVLDEDGRVLHRDTALGADLTPTLESVRQALGRP